MISTVIRRTALSAVGVFLSASPGFAHHSFAMFDRSADVVLDGAVKEFQWQNPHCYIQLIASKDGQNWTIESFGSGGLIRLNWTRNSLAPGDKVVLHFHPLRNGAPGGELISVQKADGTVLGTKPPGAAP